MPHEKQAYLSAQLLLSHVFYIYLVENYFLVVFNQCESCVCLSQFGTSSSPSYTVKNDNLVTEHMLSMWLIFSLVPRNSGEKPMTETAEREIQPLWVDTTVLV